LQITRKDIENLILKEEKDTFFNHLRNIFVKDYRPKGELGRGIIKVWKQTGWNGFFYPVFIFEFNANKHLVKISDKLNPVGKMFVYIFLTGIIYFIYTTLREGLDFTENKRAVLIVSGFFLIFIGLTRRIYLIHKKDQLEQIYDFLGMEFDKQSRYSVVQVFAFRLLIYMLSLLLLAVAVFILIPKKHYLEALVVFLFVGVYVISDIYRL